MTKRTQAVAHPHTVKGAQQTAAALFHARRAAPEDKDAVEAFTQGVDSADGEQLVNNYEMQAYIEMKNSMNHAARAAFDNGAEPSSAQLTKAVYATPATVLSLLALVRQQMIGKQSAIVDVPAYRGHLRIVDAATQVFAEIRRALPVDQRSVALPRELTLRFVGKRPKNFEGPVVSLEEATVRVTVLSAEDIASAEPKIATAIEGEARAVNTGD